jgi:hypothetical protein
MEFTCLHAENTMAVNPKTRDFSALSEFLAVTAPRRTARRPPKPSAGADSVPFPQERKKRNLDDPGMDHF